MRNDKGIGFASISLPSNPASHVVLNQDHASRTRISKKHFLALDGLRGVAAFSVLFTHLGHWLGIPTLATNGTLAVDFFFCLSGFVIALSYQHRLEDGLTLQEFAGLRLIRLMPMIVLGTILTSIFVAMRAMVKHEPLNPVELGLATITGLLNIPFFDASHTIGGPQVFPLNGPQYSLFLELVVNFVWAMFAFTRRLKVSLVIAALSLPGILYLGFGGDETATFAAGFPRVFFSFYLGVIVFHVARIADPHLKLTLYFSLLVAMLIGFFYFPAPLPTSAMLLWIAVGTPCLVFSGTRVALPPVLESAAEFLGDISYPVYALHYPIFCWVNGVFQTAFGRDHYISVEVLLVFVVVTGVSFTLLRVYDEPIRRSLNRMLGAH